MEVGFRKQRQYVGGHQFCKYFDMWGDTVVLKRLFKHSMFKKHVLCAVMLSEILMGAGVWAVAPDT